MRPAHNKPSPWIASPAIRIAVGKPDRSISTALSIAVVSGMAVRETGGAGAAEALSPQEISAGMIRVAMRPGAVVAAATAAEASFPTSGALDEVRTQCE